MNKEYVICQKCPIKRRCHPALSPTFLSEDGKRQYPIMRYEDPEVELCDKFTCLGDGMRAARGAREHGRYTRTTVVEMNNTAHEEDIAIFGSGTKPTDRLGLRGIAKNGHIYALGSDGVYYRAGRYVTPLF